VKQDVCSVYIIKEEYVIDITVDEPLSADVVGASLFIA
jgi:hypothetical protein